METKVEALQDNQVKVTVTIAAADIDARIKKTYKDFAHKYNFPGFRKGKAPRPVIDNALGAEAVLATVTDAVVNESYPVAIDESDLYPVGRPQFDAEELVAGGKDYAFSFTVTVKPQFELNSYDPVEIELPAEGASQDEIDDQLEAMREHYYTFENSNANTKVKADGFVELAMKAVDDKGEEIESLTTESRLYGLGMGMMPAEFDEQLIGLKKGQTASISVDLPAGVPMLAALGDSTSKVDFEVEIKVVKKKVLPEITDEWAKETLGFESVEDMRAQVAQTIEAQKANMIPSIKENACLYKIAERTEEEAPEAMREEAEASLLQDFFTQLQAQNMPFDAYLQQQGISSDQFKNDIKMQASDITKQDLALDAWARHFEMTVTEEEVKAEFEKSGADDVEKLYKEWTANGQLHLVRQAILRTKAVTDIMDKAVVTEFDTSKKAQKAAKKPAKKAAAKKEETE